MTDPLYYLHRWDDGVVGCRLKPLAALVNLTLLSGFLWSCIAAGVRVMVEIAR